MDFIRLLSGYWWLRGVAGALSLLLFAKQYFGFSLFETAAALLATLSLWKDALGWIGALIGRIPFIPPLTADQALYLSLLLTFSVPAGFRAVSDLGILVDASSRQLRLSKLKSELAPLETRPGIRNRSRLTALRREVAKLNGESSILEVLLSFLLFLAAGASTGLLIALLIAPTLEFGDLSVFLVGIAVCVAFALACRVGWFFVGAVTLLGFLLTIQVAYMLDAPWLHEYVQAHAAAAVSHEDLP